MPGFDDTRNELAAWRSGREQTQKALLLARESVKRGTRGAEEQLRELEQTAKSLDARGAGLWEAFVKELAAWRDEREQTQNALLLARESVKRGTRGAEEQLRELEQTAKSLDARGAGMWEAIDEFASPKAALRQLPDRHPILLFPLRLETRFKTVDRQAQLWVRVYPDPCLAESFEPALTEAEARNAQIFWAGIWRAGGVDAEERSAWRDLARAHGVGRASWIVRHHAAPEFTADQPQRTKPSDVLLVIVAMADAPAKTAEFWEKVWRAGGTEAAVVAERTALEQQVDAATAKRIVEEFTPVNLGQPPGTGETRATNGVKVAVIKFTPLADLALRRTSWSRAPRVRLLPERFVLMAWRDNRNWRSRKKARSSRHHLPSDLIPREPATNSSNRTATTCRSRSQSAGC